MVLDPPKFVHSADQLVAGSRGYKDINLLGLALTRPGGVLATFSCSGHVDAALFQKIVAGAAVDAGRTAQILERLSQPADHPVATEFPEGDYLKGLDPAGPLRRGRISKSSPRAHRRYECSITDTRV